MDVRHNYGGLVVVVVVLVVVATRVVGVGVGVFGGRALAGMFEFVFPLVECPGRELAVVEGCFDV